MTEPAHVRLPPGPGHFAARLVAWQRQHGRHGLPWQRDRNPYHVWLSEIMLQQTQVSVVLSYYDRFLQRFPTVQQLAAASIDDVLAQWSGLGYYRRARNLHLCAQQVCSQYSGSFPRTQRELTLLSGVGRSTAAAIAAFCFDERAAILDANVKRVLGRAFAMPPTSTRAAEQRALWQLAESLLPEDQLAAYTQGLMDLGAMVCKPRKLECASCPFHADCQTRQGQLAPAPAAGMPAVSVAPSSATRPRSRPTRHWALLWAEDATSCEPRVWLVRRSAQGIWGNLWCFPQFTSIPEALQRAATLGSVSDYRELAQETHALTHLNLQLQPLLVRLAPVAPGEHDAQGGWFDLEAALALGLPAPIRRLLNRYAASAAPLTLRAADSDASGGARAVAYCSECDASTMPC